MLNVRVEIGQELLHGRKVLGIHHRPETETGLKAVFSNCVLMNIYR